MVAIQIKETGEKTMRSRLITNTESDNRTSDLSEDELNREHRKMALRPKELESAAGSRVFQITNARANVKGVRSTGGITPYWFK
jgi:hypothetical protein